MRRTIVCLCGSTRFSEAFRHANLIETLAGRIVLTVGCDTKSDDILGLGPNCKADLDALHKDKIAMADEVLILNCKLPHCFQCHAWGTMPIGALNPDHPCPDCGSRSVEMEPYIGESTRSEIAYAKDLGKTIRWLEPI